MTRRRRRTSPVRSALRSAAVITAIIAGNSAGVAAQETGTLRVNLGPGGEHGVFMISCIRDGEVVFQTEGDWGSGPHCTIGGSTDIPVGAYDVRVEGDGLLTQVRRGVLVTAQNVNNLYVVMEQGEGVRTIEYATGALAREEVAARLRALEAAQAEMREQIAGLERRVAELTGADARR